MLNKKTLLVLGLLLLQFMRNAPAQDLPVTAPEAVGLSSDRLSKIRQTLKQFTDSGELAGAVAVVARQGQVAYFEALGKLDLETPKPMRPDAIFRIASMTKMVTTVAVMMLYEDGHFALYDPVSKFIPAFKDMQVAGSNVQDTTPADDAITIKHLLTHTSGITYASGSYAVDALYREAGLRSWDKSLAEFVTALTQIPLAFQPGTNWEYSLSTDVLGYLIEVISGQTLAEFFSERIFEPLNMPDTGFVVPKSELGRLANVYEFKDGNLRLLESTADTPLSQPPPAFSGGGGWAQLGSDGGLVSTPMDYLRFLQMILNGGVLNDKRLLSRKSVELMLTDHLQGLETWLGPGIGFGFGFAVLTDLAAYGEIGTPGMIWWAGSDNTYFWIDRKESMIGLLMTQIRPFGHLDLMGRFQQLALQSITD